MEGYGSSIGAAQAAPGGQKVLGAMSQNGSGAFAAGVQNLPAMLKNMAAAQQQVFGEVEKTVMGTQIYLQGATAEMTTNSAALGAVSMTAMAGGIQANQQGLWDSMRTAQMPISGMTKPGSPPAIGPLSMAEGNPLYEGGKNMMSLMAKGVEDGQLDLENAMSAALVNSFAFAMGKYEEEALKSLSVSTVMAKVADTVVRNLSGVGTIQLSTEEKKVLKASIDVPGMAGVAGAIIADGNLTRKYLDRIAKATEGMYENMGGQAGKGKPLAVKMAAH
jgi:hypothetical protein